MLKFIQNKKGKKRKWLSCIILRKIKLKYLIFSSHEGLKPEANIYLDVAETNTSLRSQLFIFFKIFMVLKFWGWIMPSFEYPLLAATCPYFPTWIDSCQHCAELRALLQKHPQTYRNNCKRIEWGRCEKQAMRANRGEMVHWSERGQVVAEISVL